MTPSSEHDLNLADERLPGRQAFLSASSPGAIGSQYTKTASALNSQSRHSPSCAISSELWQQYRLSHCPRLKREIARSCLPLVERITQGVGNKLPKHVDPNDLFQDGYMALLKIINKYDPSKGPFENFAAKRIKGAILDNLRRQDPISRSLRSCIREMKKAATYLWTVNGRPPSEEEIRARINETRANAKNPKPAMSLADYNKLVRAIPSATTISLEYSPNGSTTIHGTNRAPKPIGSLLADHKNSDPIERLSRIDLCSLLLMSLSSTERQVFILHYEEGLTLEEIGEKLGKTQSRISQIHGQALRRLREHFANNGNNGKCASGHPLLDL